MIEDWRRQWKVGDFPFLYVQISNFKSSPAQDWALLRDQQLKTLALRNTAMAVTIDIGNPDNVHPTDKVDVGLRLARAARALSYGEQVEYSGPLFRQATPEGPVMRVWFDHAKGLTAKGADVTGFEVAAADGKFSRLRQRSKAQPWWLQVPQFQSPYLYATVGPIARSAISSTARGCPLHRSCLGSSSVPTAEGDSLRVRLKTAKAVPVQEQGAGIGREFRTRRRSPVNQ